MLHPVGPLPAAVYWRRRLMVLTLLLAVLGGGGWLGVALATREPEGTRPAASSSSAAPEPAEPPALERVVPSLASVQTPTPPAAASVPPPAPEVPVDTGPQPGGPCSDEMIAVEVRAPASVPVGSGPTVELVVTNVSPAPCSRVLDAELQEIVLLDSDGARRWGSNDCQPESSDDVRLLAPGEQAVFPLVWSGLSSEPGCAAPRTAMPAGQYVLRGRLDTRPSPDTPLTIA
ncbi:MucR family transcriptional regulator [Blastococcus sp. TF02A-26]|uniref:MucR family transcriptional regulator n=1 Tax=Blastococcus sp. TF02A-26 TaxID=2250577 RepID=UPI000DE98B6E|nr:MucR family transcriptional regulator [Blastococcus sp. TF02A-26]RBY84183.1 MucR family transcriptional regulator [Blastococcus sp. TF02A-26]